MKIGAEVVTQEVDGGVDRVVIEFRKRVVDEVDVVEARACRFDVPLLDDLKVVVFSVFSLRGVLRRH